MAKDEIRPRREDFSPLSKHHRQSTVFTPPLMRIPGVELHSWCNDRLPEMLWAALLTEAVPREQYIRYISVIVKAAMRFRDNPNIYPQHTASAHLTKEQFRALFGNLLAEEAARNALSPLLLFESLPDRAHWEAYLTVPDPKIGSSALAAAMAHCMDGRGRPAIDIRWLRIMFLGLQHRLMVPRGKFEDIVEMLCAYPQLGEPSEETDALIASMKVSLVMAPRQSFPWLGAKRFGRNAWIRPIVSLLGSQCQNLSSRTSLQSNAGAKSIGVCSSVSLKRWKPLTWTLGTMRCSGWHCMPCLW